MKRTRIILIICMIVNVAGFGQTKAKQTHNEPDVYVVGYELSAENILAAKLWINGLPQNISGGIKVNDECGFPVSVAGCSVYVSDNDVYIAGYENEQEKGVAKLWINGAAQYLSDDSRWGKAASVFVSDNNVYTAGSKTWKNGNVLYGYEDDCLGNSIFVSDSNVYVAGRRGNDAVFWKNGVTGELPGREGGGDAEANSVYVSGGDVYIAGWKGFFNDNGTEYLIAVLWKNGEEIQLTDGTNEAEANSVFVSGNDVYVAGRYGYDAVLWKNGVMQKLTNGDETSANIANSVYVLGSDVYVAGVANGVAKLWENGVEQILITNGSKSSVAYGVFVKCSTICQ